MKKTRILSLLLGLSLLCTLIVPATVYADDPPADSGMKISKTATANADGSYTITLEAYATGEKVISEITKDVPTDIILVLDQSGSMANDIGTVSFQQYQNSSSFFETTYRTRNQDYYEYRHNGGSSNLWHKLADGSYVSVSVTRQENPSYTAITNGRNNSTSGRATNYWDNQNNLYALVNGEYLKVTVKRTKYNGTYTYTLPDGTKIASQSGANQSPTFTGIEGNVIYLAAVDDAATTYTYTYTDSNENVQTIGTSTGATTVFSTALYERITSTSGGGTRLNALKNAVNNFASAVQTKSLGKDGQVGGGDDIDHRIALVGFSSPDYSNTELLTGSSINQGSWKETNIGNNDYTGYYYFPTGYEMNGPQYGSISDAQYKAALLAMNTDAGLSGVTSGVNALTAWGGTRTDNGLAMANKIFEQNPIPNGEKRNRVVIVFTDGIPGLTGYDSDVASSAITQASTAKSTYGATVYAIGIFSGADATSAGSTGYNSSDADKGNYFLQRVSSNTQYPQSPSYYLSAADAGSLNNIFKQISDQIETGGSSSTLTSEAVVKDIISPQFTLPDGATASSITLETYRCTGKNGSDYTWSKNADAMGAKASISGDQVNVTGFNFSENYVGTVTENGNTSYRGHKLVISFKVRPKAGFLGGNDVITNASAGIYENASAQTPVMTFEQPKVNVPIKDVTVTATDKNVYLLGDVTADQLKDGATVKVGDVELNLSKANQNYGLEPWQNAYVDITVRVKGKDGTVVSDKLEALKEDTTYTVEVTVAPKTAASAGTPATVKTGQNTPAKINVFKPELIFKDSQIDLGETANYENNKADTNFEVWKHGDTLSDNAAMIGTEPELTLSYNPLVAAFTQDTPVKVTVKIGAADVTMYTTFKHEECRFEGCKWNDLYAEGKPEHGKAHFIVHVKSFDLTIQKEGWEEIDENQSFVFKVTKDGDSTFSMDVVIQGNSSVTIKSLKPGTYTVTEETDWSWRYTPKGGKSQMVNPAAENVQKDTNGAVLVTFDNERENDKWLNGGAWCKNLWGTPTPIKSN